MPPSGKKSSSKSENIKFPSDSFAKPSPFEDDKKITLFNDSISIIVLLGSPLLSSSDEELVKIINRSSGILWIEIDQSGSEEIAGRSRGTPRIANRILRRARDFAQVKSQGKITEEVASMALDRMGIDKSGLDDIDRRILNSLVDKYHGGPVGLDTLGVSISEDAKTIEEVYEPFLIKEGFIQRTPRGRIALNKTFKYLGKPGINKQLYNN